MPVTRRLGERALNVGVPDALYRAAQRVAEKEAQSLAAITRRALADYVRQRGEGFTNDEVVSSRRDLPAKKR